MGHAKSWHAGAHRTGEYSTLKEEYRSVTIVCKAYAESPPWLESMILVPKTARLSYWSHA